MANVLEHFGKLPTGAKAGVGGGLVVIVVVVYYFAFYASRAQEKESLLAQKASLEQEKGNYEARVQDYLAFRNEVAKLLEEQKDLLRILPKDAEIPGYLDQIHQQGELVGIEVLEFTRQPDVARDFFAQIPVSMRISGQFHHVAKFFRNVSQLRRIVNIQGLKLSASSTNGKDVSLSATFMAATFRFIDRGPPGGVKPQAATP